MTSHPETLINSGLTGDQATVYSDLLTHGLSAARRVAGRTGIKRGLVYKVLEQLISLGLAERRDKDGAVAMFLPNHPARLQEIMDARISELSAAKAHLDSLLGGLVSEYNLLSGKPNVRFYEGKGGMSEVLDDSLYAKGEILSYVDIEAIERYIPEVNEAYAKKREKLGIVKKGIVVDTPQARTILKGYHSAVTETRFMKCDFKPSGTIMQIYDNKVSYLTLGDISMIGIIVEDPHIYRMHCDLFAYAWNTLSPEGSEMPSMPHE